MFAFDFTLLTYTRNADGVSNNDTKRKQFPTHAKTDESG